MQTEEQAREKWCPWARAVLGIDLDTMNAAVGNRTGPVEIGAAATNCFASGCMAWRTGPGWIKRLVYQKTDAFKAYRKARFSGEPASHNGTFEFDGHRWQYEVSTFNDNGEYDLISRPDPDAPVRGYCGLAGAPQ